jgi:hypothetical protein
MKEVAGASMRKYVKRKGCTFLMQKEANHRVHRGAAEGTERAASLQDSVQREKNTKSAETSGRGRKCVVVGTFFGFSVRGSEL